MLVPLQTKQPSDTPEIIQSYLDRKALQAPPLHAQQIKKGHIRVQAEYDDQGLLKKLLNDPVLARQLSKEDKISIISNNRRETFEDFLKELELDPLNLPDSVSNVHLRDNMVGTISHFEIDCSKEMMDKISKVSMIKRVRDITKVAEHLMKLYLKDVA